ncbi:unnamed protein product [Meloidogyne enterolobii]|nr:unnamed protein product [Meloidogyne enterolobii]
MVKWHSAKTFAALEGGGRAGELSAATGGSEPLQVQYELLGFGPNFRLQIKIFCSGEIENVERWLIFIFNEQEYSFSHRMIFIPRLFPNKQLKFYSDIYCLHPDKQHLIGEEETEIRIILMRKDRTKPVWSANFQMPASELLIE